MTSEERLRALVQALLRAPDTEARYWAADDLAGECVQRIEDHRDTPAELADEISAAIPWVAGVHLETLLDLADRVDASGSRAQITELLERRLVLPGIVAP